ncbi:hypothetical protein [Sphingobacterium yanglingense]|uniref:DUF4468 domain-containing protein n=1 Tax=Sphingobacterium yanglingense TaxID=1437280 RepID=A0A4R6WMG5_9SPHI|nr:hypothetical protein [Sphingobacterium yanglingense]TDQ80227.1 hypothetical protein CLV99_1684 [Sphingobacterium yanglingense]
MTLVDMTKFFFVLLMVCSVHTFGQTLKITPNGFVDRRDSSKKYIILDFPNISKRELFKETIKYINANYEHPEEITNLLNDEQIVITDFELIKVNAGFLGGGSIDLQYYYKYDLQFKDGKIRFDPKFDFLKYWDSNTIISLIGERSFAAGATGLFNRKGKATNDKMVQAVEDKTNAFIQSLKERINSLNDSNW